MQQPGSEKAVRDLGDYDTVTFRTLSAAGSGLLIGSWLGGAVATWHYGPTVNRKEGWTALRSTLRTCANYGVTFAAVGGIYAFTDAVAERIRGKKDFVNGVIAGFAVGPVIGIRARSFPVGLGASVAFAALSALVDAGGQTVRTPTNKEYVTYSRENPRL